ncbi:MULTISPECIES: hypothetical protein [unclassified Synechococcus]|uniref:hypothetical protein n=1 Tax=unclassified Synechococcus TaxID=2626047 RepID=UPI001C237269|nr:MULTISPECIES: hypothetical protein [unclassified Synechococcus]
MTFMLPTQCLAVSSSFLLGSMLYPLPAVFAAPAGSADAQPKNISVEWTAPPSQAEIVIDSLGFKGSISAVQSDNTDTKAFPVVLVLTGIVAFQELSATIREIARETRPGAIITKKPDGTVAIVQTKAIPSGCVVLDQGTKFSDCLITPGNSKEQTDKVLSKLLLNSPR